MAVVVNLETGVLCWFLTLATDGKPLDTMIQWFYQFPSLCGPLMGSNMFYYQRVHWSCCPVSSKVPRGLTSTKTDGRWDPADLWGSLLKCVWCPDTWIVVRKRMQNISITLQPILSEKDLPAKIFMSSMDSVTVEWLGSVLYIPSLFDLIWRLGPELSRAVVPVVSAGSFVEGWSGHCTRCWQLTNQLFRWSRHRQDGLVAYGLYSLFGHWLFIR